MEQTLNIESYNLKQNKVHRLKQDLKSKIKSQFINPSKKICNFLFVFRNDLKFMGASPNFLASPSMKAFVWSDNSKEVLIDWHSTSSTSLQLLADGWRWLNLSFSLIIVIDWTPSSKMCCRLCTMGLFLFRVAFKIY